MDTTSNDMGTNDMETQPQSKKMKIIDEWKPNEEEDWEHDMQIDDCVSAGVGCHLG